MSNTSQIGENPSVKVLKSISKQLDKVAGLLGRLPIIPTTTTTTTATPTTTTTTTAAPGTVGSSIYKLISATSTNASIVKASGGNLNSIIAIGLTSSVRFLKIYNKATLPSVGIDIPVMTIPIPANIQGAGIVIPFSVGVKFPLGIGLAITSGIADNDTGAITASDVTITLTYS